MLRTSMFRSYYALDPAGTAESINRLTIADCRAHLNHILSSPVVVSFSGPIPLPRLLPILRQFFSGFPRAEPKLLPKSRAIFRVQPPRNVVRRKEIDQPFYLLAYPIKRSVPGMSADFYVTLKLVNTILGGGMGSLLFNQLREKEGVGYQVGALLPVRRFGMYMGLYMGTHIAQPALAFRKLRSVVTLMTADKFAESDFTRARNYLAGTIALDHQTTHRVSWYRGFFECVGLGAKFDLQYANRVRRISRQDLVSCAQSVFRANAIQIQLLPEKKQ